jgi:hypothetical protein
MCVKLLCKTNSVYYLKINAYIVLLSHTTLETKKANDIAVNPIFQGSSKGLLYLQLMQTVQVGTNFNF